MKQTINISDDFMFYTLEGEGRWVSYPTVFMRLAGCNLTCKGFISKNSPHGCDSYVSWCKSTRMTYDEINTYFEIYDLIDKIRSGAILKISGGEPMLQEESVYNWVIQFIQQYDLHNLHLDFETNATITPKYFDKVLQYNGNVTYTTSPKLSNNGDAKIKRYHPDTIQWLNARNACFKFVINTESQVDEIYSDFINPQLVDKCNVWLMPCCGSRSELLENGPLVAEICKKYGFKFSNRLHLQLWDKALKV